VEHEFISYSAVLKRCRPKRFIRLLPVVRSAFWAHPMISLSVPASENARVTGAGVPIRNLKVREVPGRINVPTTSKSSNRSLLMSCAAEPNQIWPERKLRSHVSRKGNHSLH
jgi:hypothetical protein